ncbi:MAG: Gfo/Idh/MocA family oxidoreductase [Paracoccaceae bacterium]
MATEKDPVVLLGGGRWARVILSVLTDLDRVRQVIWVTRHGFEENQRWLATEGSSSVTVQSPDVSFWNQNPSAVIIAVQTWRHAALLQEAIENQVPALCEKPFALDYGQAQHLVQLAQDKGTIAGVNLEFLYASYLHDFKNALALQALRTVHIDWQDPIFEIRHGQKKFGDVYTPLVHDSLPHCWSLLHVLTEETHVNLEHLDFSEDGQITLTGTCNATNVKITLNRRGVSRVRRVSVNEGEAVLDFSQEPGTMQLFGNAPTTNEWRVGRPLRASLCAFFDAIENPSEHFPASVQNCLPSVALSQDAFNRSQSLLRQKLLELDRKGSLSADEPYVQNLLVDLLVPQLETRPDVHSREKLVAFSTNAINDRLWDR